jgi:hypothetical protein
MPDSSLVGGSAVRFGAILDLPIVLPSHRDPCNRMHRPHLQPSAIRCARVCNDPESYCAWPWLGQPHARSAPWTIDRNSSHVEAYRHHVL